MLSDDEASILELPPPPATHRLRYGPAAEHFGDLFLPTAPGPFPLAIALHGGFWRARFGLEHLGALCASLAKAGVAVWSLEYRRLGNVGGGYPGTLEDVALGAAASLRWADRYRLDLSRTLAFGHSAGGQLALWLASRRPLSVRAAVGLAAVSDLRQAARLRLGAGVVEQFLGGTPEAVSEHYADASPKERLPLGVPQLLFHGALDDTVPPSLTEAYVDAALAAGDSAKATFFPTAGHFALIDPRRAEGQRVVAAIAELLSGPGGSPHPPRSSGR